MKIHYLKCIPLHFNDVIKGLKKVEIRNKDRDFKVNDVIFLKEYNHYEDSYSGRFVCAKISHVLKDFVALDPDYWALSIVVLFSGEEY